MALANEPKDGLDFDAEKDVQSVSEKGQDDFQYSHPLFRKLLSLGVETRGAQTCLAASVPTYHLF